ncbi:PEP-CTERM sorting domain-containing protein [Akkermansia sp.]
MSTGLSVPEPSTAILLLLATGSMLARRRRFH